MRWLLVWIGCSAWAQNDEMQAALDKQRAAAQIQRQAVRKQAELAGPKPLRRTLIPAPVQTPCEPIADSALNPLIEAAAKTAKLAPELVRAVIQQESAFRPCAVSEHNAKGLMQLKPVVLEQFSVRDPFDPKENIEAGTKYLKQLIDRYQGETARALSAYRVGPEGPADLPEVRSYVDTILKNSSTPPALPQNPKPKPTEN
jgi:soluble lytic murein transglycosylase-like protein